MSILVTGTVVDDASGKPLPKIFVEARGDFALTSERLAVTRTRSDGKYSLVVKGAEGSATHPVIFSVRAVDVAGRPISADHDVAGDSNQTVAPIKVRAADREGLIVTLLTGQSSMVSDGNALTLLVDGEKAFGRIAADVAAAKGSVDITQLFLDVADFKPDPADEHPRTIFVFGEPPLNPDNPNGNEPPRPHQLRPHDVRPERLLIDMANHKVDVRILFNDTSLGWPEGVFWLTILPPLAASIPVLLLALAGVGFVLLPLWLFLTAFFYLAEIQEAHDALQAASDVKRVRAYFQQAMANAAPTAGSITVRGMRQAAPEHGVLHCKMVIVDGKRAVVVGSPFVQRYFDGPDHLIDEPRRGLVTDPAVHDVSIGVVGPAVTDLHETLMLYWNEEAAADQKMKALPLAPPGSGDDGVAKVQVIRTLSGTRFASLNGKSEKGILEAYLRAFASARDYIYIENQYLTETAIIDGLVNVLTEFTNLQLIMMVNIKPDMPFYPGSQARQIARLRAAGGDRVGAFTRWSYRAGVFPSIAQVYLHTKSAVVDDTWATIGSANLDGLSLDHNIALSPLTVGETTAAELNISVVGGADGKAFSTHVRRRLWAEHLGLYADGKPNPDDHLLLTRPAGGWVSMWRNHAVAALQHIKSQGIVPLPGCVLEYPAEDGGSLTSPRKHLAALGIDVHTIRPVAKISQFDFYNNRWRTRSIEDTE
jgi:phosphatidylserine/phosphatidylglycerophosphate/cardiolipin synthase-like enzyme